MARKNVPVIILDDSEDESPAVRSPLVQQRARQYPIIETSHINGQLYGHRDLAARESVPITASSSPGRYSNNITPVSSAQQASQRPQARDQACISGTRPRAISGAPSSNTTRNSRFYNDIARHIIKTFPYHEFAESHNCEVEHVRLTVLEKVVQPMLNQTRAQSAREEAQSMAQAEVQAQVQAQLYGQAQARAQVQDQAQFQTTKGGCNTHVVPVQGNSNPVYVQPYFQTPIRTTPVDPNIIDPALMNPVQNTSNKPTDKSIPLQNPAPEPAGQAHVMPDPAPETSPRKRQMSEVEIVDISTSSPASTVQQSSTPSKRAKISPMPETENMAPAPATSTPAPTGCVSIGNRGIPCRIPESTSMSGATATLAASMPQPIVIDDEDPKDFPANPNIHPIVVPNPGGTRSESEEPLAARCRSLRKSVNGTSGSEEQIVDINNDKATVRQRNLYDIATQRDKEIWKKHVLEPHLRKSGKGIENLVDNGKAEAEVPVGFDLSMQ